MAKKNVKFAAPPFEGTPKGKTAAPPTDRRITRAAAKKLLTPGALSETETAPHVGQKRHRTSPQPTLRATPLIERPIKKARIVSPKPESPKKKAKHVSPQPKGPRPMDGFEFTFTPPPVLPVKARQRAKLQAPPKTQGNSVPPTANSHPERTKKKKKTPPSTKPAREAAGSGAFRLGAPRPPVLLHDRRASRQEALARAPRSRQEALAREARAKALARAARRGSAPFPKWVGIEINRLHPLLLVNKPGAKPRLAKVGSEAEAYQRLARENNWIPTGDPMELDGGDPMRQRQSTPRSTPSVGTIPSKFPEPDEGPSPQKKPHHGDDLLFQGLAAGIEDLDDDEDMDRSVDMNMVKKIREFKAIFGRMWAARSLTDLGYGLLAVGLKGLEREKVMLARREARAEALMKRARRRERRRLRGTRRPGENGPSRAAQAGAEVKRLPRKRRDRYGDDNRAVFGVPTEIDPDFWKYFLGHETLYSYSPENLGYLPDAVEEEEGPEEEEEPEDMEGMSTEASSDDSDSDIFSIEDLNLDENDSEITTYDDDDEDDDDEDGDKEYEADFGIE